jgi:preprotein translocase subunit YajC
MRCWRDPDVDSPLVQDLFPVLFLAGIALLFWLVLIRPQVRRQRELAHLQSTLEVGDEVLLTSGIHGTVRGLDEGVAQVEIAAGVTIRVARGAVGQVVNEVEHEVEEDDDPVDTAHTNDGEVPEEN